MILLRLNRPCKEVTKREGREGKKDRPYIYVSEYHVVSGTLVLLFSVFLTIESSTFLRRINFCDTNLHSRDLNSWRRKELSSFYWEKEGIRLEELKER